MGRSGTKVKSPKYRVSRVGRKCSFSSAGCKDAVLRFTKSALVKRGMQHEPLWAPPESLLTGLKGERPACGKKTYPTCPEQVALVTMSGNLCTWLQRSAEAPFRVTAQKQRFKGATHPTSARPLFGVSRVTPFVPSFILVRSALVLRGT